MRALEGGAARTLAECLPMGACAANAKLDARLVLGAALFGAGWGLSGICPGPSIVALGGPGSATNAVMLPFTILGMVAVELATGTGK